MDRAIRNRGLTTIGAALAAFAAGSAVAGPALPKITTEYGIEFVTIGDPGNRAPTPEENPNGALNIQGVPYRYRLSRTEVTNSQWLEFVQAYAPYHQGPPIDTAFIGAGISWTPQTGYYVFPGGENYPANPTWRYAARFMNWMHHDRSSEQWAFESGAYDTTTFGENPDGSITDQFSRSPGARFWLPSVDEWVKGAFWDPAKDGEGGYWLYPYQRSEPPVSGPPEDGGQTNAGPVGGPYDVGSYRDSWQPWGMLDASGGMREMTEGASGGGVVLRIGFGAPAGDPLWYYFDQLGAPVILPHWGNISGVRIGAQVPAASSMGLWVGCMWLGCSRRRS